MAKRKCWNCEQTSHLSPVGSIIPTLSEDDTNGRVFAAYSCDECKAISILDTYVLRDVIEHGSDAERRSRIESQIQYGAGSWLPKLVSGQSYPDVPAEIASAASEAHRCASIDAYRGSIMLARAVIEATAKAKDIPKGTLEVKIDKMYEQHLIREHIRDAAHSIRDIGNEMERGDLGGQEVTREEVDLTLELMGEILNEVFQSPARTAKHQAAVAARKNAPPPSG